ncbi:DUF2971 domain-containing protein [Pseudomonas azotoformans]|uniref:DUF2971 domain-containing protein n=1 Tax=Pseudomonas azotoformans TaxID=47878 RepID=UPI0009901B14|nr:DUF2971 domain-containing protein [Pseudomonas azotoformans]AQT95942.1 hypothetical protein B1R45_22745 [Pseudomonas azotoformans]UMY48070.1 DUF2971 domain-containing protein [Pseudomonas azotoformans]
MTIPSHLYKYQTKTEYSLASLKKGTVWLSSPTSFNDPFDCAINLDRKKIKESLAHAVDEITKGANVSEEAMLGFKTVKPADEIAYDQLRESLKEVMQSIGVLCLSEVPDEILMWSHYANYHKGFCIEYALGENSILKEMAKPVRYTEIFPSLSLVNLPSGAKDNFLEICIYTKAIQWRYEKEWRVIMDEGGKLFKAPAPISAIIFGARMPHNDKIEIYEALKKDKNISFKEAYLLDGLFGLGFLPFNPQ